MDVIIILLLIPVLRALIFFGDWLFMSRACNKHKIYLEGAGKKASDDKKDKSRKADDWITENLTEIKRRVKKSGLHDPLHSYMDPKGYGFVGQEQISTLDNLLYLNNKVISNATYLLRRTKGYYLNQVKRSLNPLYWIEVIFYLPKNIVSASGIDISSKVAETALKVIQIIYWLVIIAAVLLNPELIRTAIENIKP